MKQCINESPERNFLFNFTKIERKQQAVLYIKAILKIKKKKKSL